MRSMLMDIRNWHQEDKTCVICVVAANILTCTIALIIYT